jgi:hypothetical protein
VTDGPGLSRRETVAVAPDGALWISTGPGLWPFTQSWRRLRRSVSAGAVDPVNLLIVATEPARVMADLRARGWERPSDGATHVTGWRGRRVRMSDHIARGTRAERVHVRLFAIGGHTVAAAHHEVADERGHHIVTSWDLAREEAVGALLDAGYGRPEPSAQLVPRDIRGASGDGRIWRILPPDG